MIVRTFTAIWTVKPRLLAVDDVRLPVRGGVAYQQIAAGAAAAAVWWPLCALTGFASLTGIPGLTVLVWLAPPLFAGWAADRPLAQERSVPEWCVAYVQRRIGPQRLTALAPAARPVHGRVRVLVWRPYPGSRRR